MAGGIADRRGGRRPARNEPADRLAAAPPLHHLGADGIVHGNRGRGSPRRLPEPIRARIVELARTRYRGVNDSHLAELLAEEEAIVIGRSSLQRLLRGAGVGTTRIRRRPKSAVHEERPSNARVAAGYGGA